MPDIHKRQITEWYNRYGDSILKYIIMMIRDYQQAEDLTQDTFMKAYKNIHTFEGKSNPKTWLYRIAHNTTLDFIRKRKPFQMMKDMIPVIQDSNPLPEELIQMKESTKELYYALGSLKSSYREVIILRKIKGFSIKETSEILNWSEEKVKTTLYRAIPVLEKRFSEEGIFNEKSNKI